MITAFKKLVYIPTWVFIFFLIAALGALVLDLYFLLTIDSLDSVMLNGLQYMKGSDEYFSIIKEIKESCYISGLVSLIVGLGSLRVLTIRTTKNSS